MAQENRRKIGRSKEIKGFVSDSRKRSQITQI